MNKSASNARVAQDEIGSLYDRIAPFYDLWGLLTESRARNRALELAAVEDGETILEVAVGTGLAFYELVKRNPNGVNLGIDLSAGMLARAEKRLQNLPGGNYLLQQGSAFELAVETESVDTLLNNYMFDLIAFADMGKILDEFHRVLKPGSKLVLVNMTEGERFGSGVYSRIYNRFPRAMGGCRGVSLEKTLAGKGFSIELREYYQQMLFPSEVILARKV